MSEIKVKTIEPSTGTNLTLGTTGDVISVASDSLKLDTWKDSGGNTLWTSDGSGTLSSIDAGLKGGGPILLATNTITSSVASVAFTTLIDSTYDEYMFIFINLAPVSAENKFTFQCSTDGGSNYNTSVTCCYFDAFHGEAGQGGAVSYSSGNSQGNGTNYQIITGNQGNDADQNLGGELHLFSPASTTLMKLFRYWGNDCYFNDYTENNFVNGYFNTTSAINAISFKFVAANISAGGKIKMYGIN